MNSAHLQLEPAAPAPLRLAGPIRQPTALAALQAVVATALLGYAIVLLLAAWAGCQWLASLAQVAVPWPAAALLCALAVLAAVGHALPLALVAFAGAASGWRWPWLGAAVLALPQLATWVPGLVAAAIARLRHG